MSFRIGQRVRANIHDSADPDYRYDGRIGVIVDITTDSLSDLTGDPRDDRLYHLEFDDDSLREMTFRHHDLEQIE